MKETLHAFVITVQQTAPCPRAMCTLYKYLKLYRLKKKHILRMLHTSVLCKAMNKCFVVRLYVRIHKVAAACYIKVY